MTSIADPRIEALNLDQGLCVNAGAGSGKTSLLVARYWEIWKQGRSEPSRIVAITFTDKAASEMKSRIREAVEDPALLDKLAEARISTIHGFCTSLLRQFPLEAGVDPNFGIMDSVQAGLSMRKALRDQARAWVEQKDKRILDCMQRFKTSEIIAMIGTLMEHRAFLRVHGIAVGRADSRQILQEAGAGAEWTPNDGELLRLGGLLLHLAQDFDAAWRRIKAAGRRLDFEDLQILALELLENPRVAERVRQDIDYLLVDEFQDTDGLQKEIFAHLAPLGRMFLVGDPKQSIYRFRGSDVSVFQGMQQEMRQGGKTVVMDINYRSVPGVLTFCNAFFAGLMAQSARPYETPHQALIPHRSQADGAPRVLAWTHAASDDKVSTDTLRMREAAHIAAMLRGWKDSAPPWENFQWSDVALLFRSMGKAYLYERELEKQGIPYVSASSGAFYAQQCIADMIHAMAAASNRKDDFSLTGFLRSPMAGISDETLYRLRGAPCLWEAMQASGDKLLLRAREMLEAWHALAAVEAPIALFRAILRDTDYEAILLSQYLGSKKAELLRRACEIAAQFAPEDGFTLDDYLEYLRELVLEEKGNAEGALPQDENAVAIMTVHKAKGLEFPLVIVPDLARWTSHNSSKIVLHETLGLGIKDGDMPGLQRQTIDREEKRKDEAEEKRILYVACTRAREMLVFSGLAPDAKQSHVWNQWLRDCAMMTRETIQDNSPELSRRTRRLPASGKSFLPEHWEFTLKDISAITLPAQRYTATEIQAMFLQKESSFRPPAPVFTETLPANTLGSMAHGVLANWDLQSPEELQRLLELEYAPAREQELLRDMLLRFAASDTAARLRSAKALHKEIPFLLPLPDAGGTFIEGTIDLMAQDEKGWTVWDYKTDTVTPDQIRCKAEEHRAQIQLYAAALLRIRGLQSVRMELYFLKPGCLWSETFTTAQAQAFLEEVCDKIKIPMKTLA